MGTAEMMETLQMLQEIMDKIRMILTGISIIAAVFSLFGGYRLLKFWVTLAGFVIGAILGVIAGVLLGAETKMLIGVVVAAGFIFACLAYSFFKAGIFLFLGVIGYVAATNLLGSLTGGETAWGLIAAGVAAGLLAGVAAVSFVRPVVIIVTSFSGASTLVSTICPLLGFESFSIIMIATIVLGLFGMIWQFVTTTSEKKKEETK